MEETHNIEYKRQWRDEWLQWICGFANAEGGIINIGLDDHGNPVGLDKIKKLMGDSIKKLVTFNLYISLVSPSLSNALSQVDCISS